MASMDRSNGTDSFTSKSRIVFLGPQTSPSSAPVLCSSGCSRWGLYLPSGLKCRSHRPALRQSSPVLLGSFPRPRTAPTRQHRRLEPVVATAPPRTRAAEGSLLPTQSRSRTSIIHVEAKAVAPQCLLQSRAGRNRDFRSWML